MVGILPMLEYFGDYPHDELWNSWSKLNPGHLRRHWYETFNQSNCICILFSMAKMSYEFLMTCYCNESMHWWFITWMVLTIFFKALARNCKIMFLWILIVPIYGISIKHVNVRMLIMEDRFTRVSVNHNESENNLKIELAVFCSPVLYEVSSHSFPNWKWIEVLYYIIS